MALLNPTPPTAVTTAFQNGLQTLLGGQIASQYHVGGPPSIPSLADVGFVAGNPPPGHSPQQVFVLGLSGLASAPSIAGARPGGWRIFAGGSQGKTVFCHVVQRPQAGWKCTACYWGDRVWNALQASQALNALPEVQLADYEARILTIPGLNMEALWLVGQTPSSTAGDLVVPSQAHQFTPALSKSGTIAMGTFLSVVGPMVTQRMSSPKSAVS